jgi:hypothetical protein
MECFIAEGWREILNANGLSGFDELWELDLKALDEPNAGRGGWSSVSRLELLGPDGGKLTVYLKRQENHLRREILRGFAGIPTLQYELESLLRLKRGGVPALEPIYFQKSSMGGSCRAILITEGLGGTRCLEDLVQGWERSGWPPPETRLELLETVAGLVRKLHRMGEQHGYLYSKHILVDVNHENFPVQPVRIHFIDLENGRHRLLPCLAARRDLDTLNRHSRRWRRTDRLRFLLAYLEIDRPTPQCRRLWKFLARRFDRKRIHRRDAASGTNGSARPHHERW